MYFSTWQVSLAAAFVHTSSLNINSCLAWTYGHFTYVCGCFLANDFRTTHGISLGLWRMEFHQENFFPSFSSRWSSSGWRWGCPWRLGIAWKVSESVEINFLMIIWLLSWLTSNLDSIARTSKCCFSWWWRGRKWSRARRRWGRRLTLDTLEKAIRKKETSSISITRSRNELLLR